MSKSNPYKNLKYSIRQCGDDEIEIRFSFLEGYTRGFIRLLFIGIFCMSWYQNAKYELPPFDEVTSTIKEDFIWAFNPDKIVYPVYERSKKTHDDPEFQRMFPNNKLLPYNEFRIPYIERRMTERVRAYFHFIWPFFLLFFLCLPRPRGVRVNRKKRVIYGPLLLGSVYRVAFVPKEGDPLGGVVYSCYGLHPLCQKHLYSLTIGIREEKNMTTSKYCLGVFPSINSQQSIDILNAIRAYLTEDNPEFLKHIKRRFSVWHYIIAVPFCNAFAIPARFKRAKADAAIDAALAEWNKKTNKQKQKWFKHFADEQQIINEKHAAEGLDNQLK